MLCVHVEQGESRVGPLCCYPGGFLCFHYLVDPAACGSPIGLGWLYVGGVVTGACEVVFGANAGLHSHWHKRVQTKGGNKR